MKYLIIICLTFLGTSVYAQKNVTGPEAKNAKIWNAKKTPTKILFTNSYKAQLNSPDFKNFKVWETKKADPATLIIIGDKRRHSLIGPNRKNFKVWKK